MKCKVLKPLVSFQRHTHTKDRLRHECRDCTATYQKGQRVRYRGMVSRRHSLKKNYGITPEQYDEMLAAQRGRCAVCGSRKSLSALTTFFCIDHDHETGRVRGLLCAPCNTGIGMLKDDPSILRKAIKYLTKKRS